MIYVTEINLQEFRGVRKLKEPIRLTGFNVLVGRNNSCKTAVLQALSLLPHPETVQPLKMKIGGNHYKMSLLMDSVRNASSLVYKYSGEATINYELPEIRYDLIIKDDGGVISRIGNNDISAGAIVQRLKMNQNEAGDWLLFIPNDSEFVSVVERELFNNWSRVVKSKSHIKIARDIINPTIDEYFTEIIKEESELKVRKEVGGEPYYIAVGDLGKGVYKALCILLLISVINPKVIIWDDFETAAHPSLLKKLLEWLSQGDSQVILATHSIDTLNELAEIKPEDAQIIQIKKTSEDELTHKTLTIEELSDLLNSGIDPRIIVDKIE